MTEQSSKKSENMVYSPQHHVPIGQAIKLENGDYGLRVTLQVVPSAPPPAP